ncbi:MAG TPA: SgcJ/EcaC family oxidoreductase [Rhizobiaceae bacterium]|nr:SgcJ/EcaC family oxidoreductase [Rhizobiaceae bacterium]
MMAGSEIDTIEECLDRIRVAWDEGNAHAYAAEFTEDATYVIFLGEALIGRRWIENTHADVFAKWQKGTRMVIEVIGKNLLAPGIASVLTVGGIGKGRQIPYDKMQTFTLPQQDGRWKCTSFQNTRMSRRAKRIHNPGSAAGILGLLRRGQALASR